MRDYQLYVGGHDLPGINQVHAIPAQLMLDDVITAVSLKRRLDRGEPIRSGDEVLSRCQVAGREELDAAVVAAAAAKRAWAATPFDRRMELLPGSTTR